MTTIGVSIPIPAPWGAELQRHRCRFGDRLAMGIPTHVTLLPPTEVSMDVLPDIRKHLSEVAGQVAPFPMILRGTGSFRPVSPVVFVQVAQGVASCEVLERQVRSGPLSRELRFPYHPHVTVAHDVEPEQMDRAFEELATFACTFEVSGFDLYVHGTDGVWRAIDRLCFGGSPEEAPQAPARPGAPGPNGTCEKPPVPGMRLRPAQG